MAELAYQVTGFAYQGSGQFAYQGSVDGAVVPAPSGGGGGGDPRQSRADFDIFGKSKRPQDEPKPKAVEKVARENADAIIDKAQEIARERAALRALQQDARRAKAKAEAISAAEAKLAALEAEMAILQDDEEVLLTFIRIL